MKLELYAKSVLLIIFCTRASVLAQSVPNTSTRSTDPTIPRSSDAVPYKTTTSFTGQIPSRDIQEKFLLTADIVSRKPTSVGTTHTEKAKMSDGRLAHDAHIQCLDEYRPIFRGKNGTVEKNFRDTYKFNIAAYRLDKVLNLNMIPVSVEREVDGKQCSLTWWVDDVKMSEEERRDKQIKAPADQSWIDQLNKVRVFDQLIYNTDRNQGNLLITNDWKLWMIDHTRAFRTSHALLKPDALMRCDYNLLAGMKKLNAARLTKDLAPYVRPEEITALLARRDVIVKFFDSQVRTKGDDSVLTGIPRSTPVVSIP
ncbi:MAG TPA: hypothetical protein VMZ52_18045 [Bryobacteraceae bacterium]|nr:hypothetical protein [Bryobacteraceae bacterium]